MFLLNVHRFHAARPAGAAKRALELINDWLPAQEALSDEGSFEHAPNAAKDAPVEAFPEHLLISRRPPNQKKHRSQERRH